VVNCQETHTHSIRPEHGGMFHSQFCFAAMLLHVRYLTAFKHGWNMFGLHSTLYTPRFTLSTPQSAFHTLDSILRSPHSTLYTPSFPSLHCALYTPHSTFHTPHSTLYTLHFALQLHTLHSTLYSPHIIDFDVVQLFQKIYHALGHARLLPHHDPQKGQTPNRTE
jgi:hypothetical protein